MRNLFYGLVTLFILLFPLQAFAACTGSSPTWTCTTATCDTVAKVNTCIENATENDTINFEAGTYTWSTTQLSITKGIKLIGAGKATTTVNYTYSGCGSYSDSCPSILIKPATPSNNPIIRLSGFTFNFSSTGIYATNSSTTSDCTNIRIDHCNLYSPGYVFMHIGLAHGVMDNCDIKGGMDAGGSSALWTVNAWVPGSSSSFYIEDCTWSSYSASGGFRIETNGAHRTSFRFNTITIPSTYQISPLMDLHGNHLGQTGGIGYEVYRNTIPATSIVNTMQFVDIRGGKSIMFDNAITYSSGAVSARFREEEDDDTGPPPGFTVNPINGQPQHVWDTYFWNNTYNGTILVPSLSNECGACSICGHTVPTANLDIWLHNALFNGTSGVGRGLLSAMPATCTNGSAYWATDQGNWNQSTAGMQGYGTGSGVLYKCSSANSTPGTFSAYYTPYTYPHPLRGEGTTPPSATGCTISGATFK